MKYVNLLNEMIDGKATKDVPLNKYLSWRVGGPAEIFVEPASEKDVMKTILFSLDNDIPLFVLGNGSNLLVTDRGIPGITLRTANCLNTFEPVDDKMINVGSGMLLPLLVRKTVSMGLGGLEFASGIPGTVGGAVVMNAGAHGESISSVFVQAKGYCLSKGKEMIYTEKDSAFAYRQSKFKEEDVLITSILLKFRPKNSQELISIVKKHKKSRTEKQPKEPSAGSVFKNTLKGSAGMLIEQAGLKGFRIGDAQISNKHANFIVNLGNSSASDILMIIDHVKKEVKEKFAVDLQLEVQIVGER